MTAVNPGGAIQTLLSFRMSTSPLLELRSLAKSFGGARALRGVDFNLKAGEVHALLGENGAGKSTLIKIVTGAHRPDSGTITVGGQAVSGLTPAAARKLGIACIYQQPALFPDLTVAENVGFGLRKDPRSKAEKDKAVEEALAMVGLKGYGARAAHALSGGQRQRVALARALILKPKVLLLDEPLSALDKKLREEMQLELVRLQREVGITFVIVTHDQDEALSMANRIAVMDKGRILQVAPPDATQVVEQPVSSATKVSATVTLVALLGPALVTVMV